jgi:putative transposase
MARQRRVTLANHVYHVMNRGTKHAILFENATDYLEFERTLESARARFPMRILAYCAMPTHFHLLLWPRDDGDVSRFVKWLTATHALRWNESHGCVGRGAVYQSRFRCVWVATDEQLFRTWRYIERNALSADLVSRAEDWRWCSLWRRLRGPDPHPLCDGPVRLPSDWVEALNVPPGGAPQSQLGSDPRTGTGVRPRRSRGGRTADAI